ncbi:spermidine synthase [Methylophaga pinxianii]|uniref:spermine/spermidine synthase domain-containing protein n=1 Tax=Methylophaga pinxianii TaxID=2881052 RepID=UPI001CF0FA5C|nr:spermidine synthase [Methylophaga pinxianii]MCB2426981.1 spermidine synthase [Methylophaga pinxianii]UPH44813.1 spermidine synthase [Methylophaga pinxianii]
MRLYYGGAVIYQAASDEGIIEVVDIGDKRNLHFGTYPRQSSMCLESPHSLELSYTRAMMAGLLFHPKPRNICVIGLGGGSLVKFLLHHFDDCQIDVIEYRQDVIDVAKRYFSVPQNDPRLRIHHGDGYQFVSDQFFSNGAFYDLLLVDAYDHLGMSASIEGQAFFDACAGILNDDGLMSINLWGTDRPGFSQSMQRINRSFDNQTLVLPVADKGNVIGLALKQKFNVSQLKKYRPLAESLNQQFDVDLPQSLHDLIKQNISFLNRLFL